MKNKQLQQSQVVKANESHSDPSLHSEGYYLRM
jgi:hypothetical protein